PHVQDAVGEVPFKHVSLPYVSSERRGLPPPDRRDQPGGSPGCYQGFSIIDTICTARRSTFCFWAVVSDPPSSGMKPPIDCTTTLVRSNSRPRQKLMFLKIGTRTVWTHGS